MQIVLNHPRMTLEALGPYLPAWLAQAEVSDRPLKATLNELYIFGGWQPFEGFKLRGDNALTYPGDPPQHPLATFSFVGPHADETVCFYQSSWVAIIQPDRSFEVCRMD